MPWIYVYNGRFELSKANRTRTFIFAMNVCMLYCIFLIWVSYYFQEDFSGMRCRASCTSCHSQCTDIRQSWRCLAHTGASCKCRLCRFWRSHLVCCPISSSARSVPMLMSNSTGAQPAMGRMAMQNNIELCCDLKCNSPSVSRPPTTTPQPPHHTTHKHTMQMMMREHLLAHNNGGG